MIQEIPFLSWTGKAALKIEIGAEYESQPLAVRLGIAVKIARQSRANLYGANLSGANLSHVDLSGANLSGANLSHVDLSGANLSHVDLSGADLSGANLSGANLYGANLSGANLSRANLSGADLSGANLYGANLSGANLYGYSLRSDGYFFYGVIDAGKLMIRAGCRYFTPAEARKHWKATRKGTRLGAESLALVDHIEAAYKIAKKFKE